MTAIHPYRRHDMKPEQLDELILPPPDVRTAIGAARAKKARTGMLQPPVQS
jgi:hypothetical protein